MQGPLHLTKDQKSNFTAPNTNDKTNWRGITNKGHKAPLLNSIKSGRIKDRNRRLLRPIDPL